MTVKNKNPPIFGDDTHAAQLVSDDTHAAQFVSDDTHAASLTGSLVVENINIKQATPFENGPLSSLQTVTTVNLLSVTVTPVNVTNKVTIVARIQVGAFDDGAIVEMREGSTVLIDQLVTGGIVSTVKTLTANLTDISVASHTYTLRIRFISGIGFQYGTGGAPSTADAIVPDLVVAVTDFLDTHGASLTGANNDTAELTGANNDSAILIGDNTQNTKAGVDT